MCEFKYLFSGEDGYVVRCKNCAHYQLAFASFMLTLSHGEFQSFCELVKYKCQRVDDVLTGYSKTVLLQTSAPGVFVLLTKDEVLRLHEMLEEADNEERSVSLLSLFRS